MTGPVAIIITLGLGAIIAAIKENNMTGPVAIIITLGLGAIIAAIIIYVITK
jgi:hypothetical protein